MQVACPHAQLPDWTVPPDETAILTLPALQFASVQSLLCVCENPHNALGSSIQQSGEITSLVAPVLRSWSTLP